MDLKPGLRVQSQVSDTEIVVIKGSGEHDLACGGVPVVALGDPVAGDASIDPGDEGSTLLGKRYTDPDVPSRCCAPSPATRTTLPRRGRSLATSTAQTKALPASDLSAAIASPAHPIGCDRSTTHCEKFASENMETSKWPTPTPSSLALLRPFRVAIGAVFIAHGVNHIIGGGKIAGTGRWFESLGMKPGWFHAWTASITEIGAGALLVLGLLTPFGGAGVVGVMVVAWVTNHLKNGFFIFRPGEGWEYVMVLTMSGFLLATVGSRGVEPRPGGQADLPVGVEGPGDRRGGGPGGQRRPPPHLLEASGQVAGLSSRAGGGRPGPAERRTRGGDHADRGETAAGHHQPRRKAPPDARGGAPAITATSYGHPDGQARSGGSY